MNNICIANLLFHPNFSRFPFFLFPRYFSCLYRKCICNSSNTFREKPSKCSKLSNLIVGGSRSPCCLSRDAPVSSVRNISRVEIGTRTLWHVDEQWCSLLHSINSSSRGDSVRSVRANRKCRWNGNSLQASLPFYYAFLHSSVYFPFISPESIFFSPYVMPLHLCIWIK
jgi:hypothetical protein